MLTIRREEPRSAPDGVRTRVELTDGWAWVDGPAEVTAEEVEGEVSRRAREAALIAVSREAEARRSAITAASPGKQQAYLLKYELLLRAEATDATAKTLLTDEATARGLTYEQLRDVIMGKRMAWETAAMRIETVEAASKAAVADAVDRAAVDAVVNTAKQLFAEIGG